MRITSHQTACVPLPGSRRRQVHLMVYLPHGQLQRTTQSKPPGATEGRSLRLNGQGDMVSRDATCVNIGLTFSGGSTPFFKFVAPPFRNHVQQFNCTTRRFGDETSVSSRGTTVITYLFREHNDPEYYSSPSAAIGKNHANVLQIRHTLHWNPETETIHRAGAACAAH